MSISMIEQLSSSFTDTTLPILYRDPVLNTGSKYLFDFVSPYSNPNADGNLGAGAAFQNLVDGGTGASILTGASSGGFANLTGKAGLSSSGGANSTFDLGAQYDFSVSLHAFLVVQWYKIPNPGFTSGNYGRMLGANGYTSSEVAAQWCFDDGAGALTPRGTVGSGAGGQSLASAVNTGVNAVAQLGLYWTPGTMTIFANGAQFSTTAISVPTTLTAPTANVQLRNAIAATYYRFYLEDLTVSAAAAGLTTATQALAQIAADYAANSARFT